MLEGKMLIVAVGRLNTKYSAGKLHPF